MQRDEFVALYKRYIKLTVKQFKHPTYKRQAQCNTTFSLLKQSLLQDNIVTATLANKVAGLNTSEFTKIQLNPYEIIDITGYNIHLISTSKRRTWVISTHEEFHALYQSDNGIRHVTIYSNNSKERYYLVNPNATNTTVYCSRIMES